MRKFYLFTSVVVIACLSMLTGCNDVDTNPTPQPENYTFFKFENCKSTHTSITTDIIVEDKESEYIVLISEKSYFIDHNIKSKQDLLDDDHIYFSQLAEQYEMEVYDFLKAIGWLSSGNKVGYQGINLNPETEYVVYCYGVEFDGKYYEVTTDVEYTIISTTAPAMQDVEFDIVCDVNGNSVDINITPKSYDGLYYAYVIGGDESCYVTKGNKLSDKQISELRNRAYHEFRTLIDDNGTAPESFCMSGASSLNARLEPLMSYMVAVFAVSNEQMPILCSIPSLAHFNTENTQFTDMTIDIIVSDITPYTAELTMKPSDKSAPYAAILINGVTFDELPEDEIEFMNIIIETFQPAIFHGDFSETMMPLMPNEEYVILAFGCDNKQPTTHLYYERFTAADATVGNTTIDNIVVRKVFDAEEIAAIDPAFDYLLEECECMVLVEAITNVPCDTIYWWWYEEYMRYEYSEEAYLEDLLLYGYTPSLHMIGLWYDEEFFFAGIAEDDNGNMSELYFGEPFILSREDCSPAEEFFQYVSNPSQSFVYRPNNATRSLLCK